MAVNDALDKIANCDLSSHSLVDGLHGSTMVHPLTSLREEARDSGRDITTPEFSVWMDGKYPSLRHRFHYPKKGGLHGVDATLVDPSEDSVYFAGQSLGLMPKATRSKLEREMQKWATQGFYGYFIGDVPSLYCDEAIESMTKIVGAQRDEIVVMNGLSVNLNLQLMAFYSPTADRHKILIEDRCFPSDQYAVESAIRRKGHDPKLSMLILKPRQGEETLRLTDILDVLERDGDSIALVMLPGVQHHTGQLFNMPAITAAAQRKGCIVGWDLAHAAGNVEIELHDWGVDFACWCTYKYLCSGAGGISGFFIHEKHFEAIEAMPRLEGWWSHKMSTRFQMTNVMELDHGARAFRISLPPPMLCACVEASLEVFNETSISALRQRSKLLTAYLEFLILYHFSQHQGAHAGDFEAAHARIITPSAPEERGAQLSIQFNVPVASLLKELQKRGVACDKREPNVIRATPVPLYCTFHDVFRFVDALRDAIKVVAVTQ